MKQILLLPHGTTGDVLPFLWLARHLKQSGHRPVLIASSVFEAMTRRAGIEFMPLARDDFDEMTAHPGLFRMIEGTKVATEYAGRATGDYAAAVEAWSVQNGRRPDLLLAPMACFGARLMREKHGIPLVTVHASTLLVNSMHEPPLFVPAFRCLRRLPLWLRTWLLSGPNPFDRFADPHVRKACLDHGVKPPRSLRWEWWDSPDGVLALFPDWFAQPQPDWPPQLLQWDFPLEDLSDEESLSAELRTFLAEGDKPVLFTPGTGHRHAKRYFESALELVQALQCRAIFISREATQVPAGLPASVQVVSYAPFSLVLPHVSVCVHHGGIGTLAQCLAAGVPQLITPMSHDQFDTADRIENLGAGLSVLATRFSRRSALRLLSRCLGDSSFRIRSAEHAKRLRQRRDVGPLIAWLETRMQTAPIQPIAQTS
jgi:rhamnosyltransferase subunit B